MLEHNIIDDKINAQEDFDSARPYQKPTFCFVIKSYILGVLICFTLSMLMGVPLSRFFNMLFLFF
jgi:hypothetical protein